MFRICLLNLFVLSFAIGSASGLSAKQPNIVLILADDLGYGDLGCYGHPIAKTPNLDQLAKQGVRFTQHYSNGPECSPTRTALLTGRYQQRVGGLECAIGTGNVGRYDDAIRLAQQRDLGLPASRAVIPAALRKAGYRCGIFGKWHLGYEPKFNPIEHGWSDFFGYLGGNVHYFNHRETSPLHVLFEGRLPVYREGYMTKLISDASIQFIDQPSSPFFLFVSHECPHFPYQGPDDESKVVTADNWMKLDAEAYVAMLEDLDTEVGRLLAALEDRGIADETIVVFASDNGGFQGAANMGPLRGAKGSTWEGGIRVPLIIRWPAEIAAGTVSHQPCITFDLTRSFLNVAAAETEAELDGIDIIGHVTAEKPDFSRELYWRGKRANRVWAAAREGDWKLVRQREGEQLRQWLYRLDQDIAEQRDLSGAHPDVRRRLAQSLSRWESEVAADR